jgi:hypothetical protein
MISDKAIEFCLGVLVGAVLVLVVRVIIGVVGLIAMQVP